MSAPYRPGQQWPDNRPQRPDRPPPIQFRQEEPSPPPPNKALQWALRAAGLVAIAVVSGLVWYYITNDTSATPTTGADDSTTQQPAGRYEFTAHEDMPNPDRTTECAKHAYDATKGFLADHPCDHVSRQLFVTTVDGGRTVYTSVSVVVMHDAKTADKLRRLTDTDGKGNINDVVRDHVVKIDGLTTLGGSDGYKSKQTGREVVIVESDFAPKDKSDDKKADQRQLDDISDDALRLSVKVDAGAAG